MDKDKNNYPADDDTLIPDEVTVEQINTSWTESCVKRSILKYVKNSTGDIINRALLLQRHSNLNAEKISDIVFDLNDFAAYKDTLLGVEVRNYIVEQLLEAGINGSESDRDAILNISEILMNHPLFKPIFPCVFYVFHRALTAKVLTPEELERGIRKKPGIAKLYYMRKHLSQFETDLRRLLRASEMLAFFFLKRLVETDTRYVPVLLHKTVLNEEPPTFQSFYVVCSLFMTIAEKRQVWGPQQKFELSPRIRDEVMLHVYQRLADWLLDYRVTHTEEPEPVTFAHGVFTLAFKDDMRFWHNFVKAKYSQATTHEPVPNGWYEPREFYWLVIERHYAKVYNLGLETYPRVFYEPGAPKYIPGKDNHRNSDKGHWYDQIQEISCLMQQGLLTTMPRWMVET